MIPPFTKNYSIKIQFIKIQIPELIQAIMFKYVQVVEYFEHQQTRKYPDFHKIIINITH